MTGPVNPRKLTQPVRILIAAMGGEGGGLLADWIIEAAELSGLIVQATSIPGVAQRTGATTYYLELAPATGRDEPVLGLYPVPGDVDLMIASELVEAGRAIQDGFVTRDRTVLIASSHRVHAILEKSAPGDGAIDTAPILGAAKALAKRTHITDYAALARAHDVALNALLLGAMAADPSCPVEPDALTEAIRRRGVAIEANVRGFTLGLEPPVTAAAAPAPPVLPACDIPELCDAIRETFPAGIHAIIEAGAQRTADYQDIAYGQLYLDRLGVVVAADKKAGNAQNTYELTATTARLLALWMSFEDVIRVADIKTRHTRAGRIREQAGAGEGDLVHVYEVLKPGLDELSSVLPAPVARMLVGAARKLGAAGKFNIAMHLRSTTVWGYLRLRMLARLKGLRRSGLRFKEEQAAITLWLDLVGKAARLDRHLALEIAACAELIKGYSDTRARGLEQMMEITEKLVIPAFDKEISAAVAAKSVAEARRAILEGVDDTAFDQVLAQHSAPAQQSSTAEAAPAPAE